jgi:hypothetical protein
MEIYTAFDEKDENLNDEQIAEVKPFDKEDLKKKLDNYYKRKINRNIQ